MMGPHILAMGAGLVLAPVAVTGCSPTAVLALKEGQYTCGPIAGTDKSHMVVLADSNGDRVDIYYQTGSNQGAVLGLLAPNVLIMRAGNPMIMRADAPLAQKLALASNMGTLWFFARPAGNAKAAPKRKVTATSLAQSINSQPSVR